VDPILRNRLLLNIARQCHSRTDTPRLFTFNPFCTLSE
jgi:hypothetical protein